MNITQQPIPYKDLSSPESPKLEEPKVQKKPISRWLVVASAILIGLPIFLGMCLYIINQRSLSIARKNHVPYGQPSKVATSVPTPKPKRVSIVQKIPNFLSPPSPQPEASAAAQELVDLQTEYISEKLTQTLELVFLETQSNAQYLVEKELPSGRTNRNYFEEKVFLVSTRPNIPESADLYNDRYLIYSTPEGLTRLDLETRETRQLITKVGEHDGLDSTTVPDWSVPINVDSYSLRQPQWSRDGRFVSFYQTHYEGLTIGIFDTVTGAYKHHKNGFLANLYQWGNTNHTFFSLINEMNPLEAQVLTNPLEEKTVNVLENMEGSILTLEVTFNQDDTELFMSTHDFQAKTYAIHKIQIQSRAIETLYQSNSQISGIFFDRHTDSLYFVESNEQEAKLIQLDLETRQTHTASDLPEFYQHWKLIEVTDTGFFVFRAIHAQNIQHSSDFLTQLFLVDQISGEILYRSQQFKTPVAFLGVVEKK